MGDKNFFSSTTKHDNVFFFKNVKICDFLQLFYMRETCKMVKVKIVSIDVPDHLPKYWAHL